MRQLLHWYVYGHWHIALCAVVLYAGATILSGGALEAVSIGHIFSATLFIYTLHRYVSADRMSLSGQKRYSFISNYPIHTWCILIGSGLLAAVSFFFLTKTIRWLLLISGFLSVGYVLPVLFRKRLRDIGVLKIILISIVWGLIPIIATMEAFPHSISLVLFLEHFFFIFALTIPFDLRDRSLDAHAKVSNLANTLGAKQLLTLLFICLAASVLLVITLYFQGIYALPVFVALLIFYVLQGYMTCNFEK